MFNSTKTLPSVREPNLIHDAGLKIGLFGIGLDTYWPQFDGLKDRLEGYLDIVDQKLSAIHPAVINAGLGNTITMVGVQTEDLNSSVFLIA